MWDSIILSWDHAKIQTDSDFTMKAPSGTAIFLSALLALCIELPSISGQVPEIEDPKTKEKEGECPPPRNLTVTPSMGQTCEKQCNNDGDCSGKKKCCADGCEMLCKTPAAVKLNICPTRPEEKISCVYSHRCTSDSECADNLKCCMDTCGLACLTPPGEVLGFCPPNVLPPGIDFTICTVNCSETEKCCTRGCRGSCTPVVKDKTGFCPYNPVMCSHQLPNLCESDFDCSDDEKCCISECRKRCVPALTEKPGTCPVPVTACLPEESTRPNCTSDYHCTGMAKCCIDGCSQKCIIPEML